MGELLRAKRPANPFYNRSLLFSSFVRLFVFVRSRGHDTAEDVFDGN
jgi:hypothetical protein